MNEAGDERDGYAWLDHTADIGVVVQGRTRASLFEVAAGALTDVITDRETIRERNRVSIRIEAPDLEQLLVRWLTEILARFEIEGLIFRRFAVDSLRDGRLLAQAFGETYDPARHPFRTEVKAITYHQLAIRETPAGWKTTIIFDL
ncbi:MAG: hypothetical protein A2Y95_07840 [Deltaproteobacteria bacterium RBG_13_65_10]|jgi:SHS2 domain-containing protein|nr:MAG: hypothetical protein A2Y95_07840 [Deltaproteobacteria bacterium RBG_13_65_10]